jgi:hypothetical protein
MMHFCRAPLLHTFFSIEALTHLLQAEARMSAYTQSAAGKAAMKSVRAVKEERQQGARGDEVARDWLT